MECIAQKKVKTLKPHKCWGCCEDIPVGTSVIRTVTTEDRRISTAYWCDICYSFMSQMDWFDLQDGFGYGELKQCAGYPQQEATNEL